jgi:two-component system cell cycle response regulator DivK
MLTPPTTAQWLTPARTSSHTAGDEVSDRAKRVLLVEDNDDNRIIYATALRYAGYEVIEAVTGTEGVQQARAMKPDLILMDISVPELDGWEATAILKADPETKSIIILAVTAHALPGDRERSLAAGCDGYLAKPITPAALLREVDQRFGRKTPSYHPPGPVEPRINPIR